MNKKDIIIEAVLKKMFEYAGQVPYYDNLKETKSQWQPYLKIPADNKKKWIAWGTHYLQTELGISQSRAEFEMKALDMVYGLKTN
jgi:hypothetical protein